MISTQGNEGRLTNNFSDTGSGTQNLNFWMFRGEMDKEANFEQGFFVFFFVKFLAYTLEDFLKKFMSKICYRIQI